MVASDQGSRVVSARMYSAAVQDLIDELGRLPGVGPQVGAADRLSSLETAGQMTSCAWPRPSAWSRSECSWCRHCFNIAERSGSGTDGATKGDIECDICRDPRRDPTIVCVVEEPRDIVAVEKTREYRGRYHVLQGAISPIDGIGPDKLRVRRVAGPPRPRGDQRDHSLHQPEHRGGRHRALPRFVAQAATGQGHPHRQRLPVGGDLEYADEVTLGRALEGRRELGE